MIARPPVAMVFMFYLNSFISYIAVVVQLMQGDTFLKVYDLVVYVESSLIEIGKLPPWPLMPMFREISGGPREEETPSAYALQTGTSLHHCHPCMYIPRRETQHARLFFIRNRCQWYEEPHAILCKQDGHHLMTKRDTSKESHANLSRRKVILSVEHISRSSKGRKSTTNTYEPNSPNHHASLDSQEQPK